MTTENTETTSTEAAPAPEPAAQPTAPEPAAVATEAQPEAPAADAATQSDVAAAPGPSQAAAPSATSAGPPSQSAPYRDSRPGPRGGRRGRGRFFSRRRVCSFCVDHITSIDYKDVSPLRRYVSDMFKIEGRRKTGTCAKHQRMLATAIKRARHIGLIPFSRTGALSQRFQS